MKRTRFFFSGLALVGLTIGSLLVDRALAQTPQPTAGTCAVPDYSNDPRFTCPTTATCYGPGTGTCQDGTGRNFAYVQQTASKYSQCKPPIVSTDSCGVLVPSPLCTSTGYPSRNAAGTCIGTPICTSTVTLPGCKTAGTSNQ